MARDKGGGAVGLAGHGGETAPGQRRRGADLRLVLARRGLGR